ncbi:hypothetical protein [uncultured Tenacibaculum sp.]|uniref:hypothetical protein n=1 Tax=uncultured Tenacibaculum sp. TaxID=174713 RepID=UPI00260772CC|nr:hypothetical protein [uncultured Tenacibaculum sp.]
MKTQKLNIKFYQNIAKVFYAVAKSDNSINMHEIKALKQVVKDKWLMIDETFDMFGTDTAYQIEVVFDWLYSKNATTEDCFTDFLEYYNNYYYFFTREIKQLIIETSYRIAEAFKGKNKAELLILEKLEHELTRLVS